MAGNPKDVKIVPPFVKELGEFREKLAASRTSPRKRVELEAPQGPLQDFLRKIDILQARLEAYRGKLIEPAFVECAEAVSSLRVDVEAFRNANQSGVYSRIIDILDTAIRGTEEAAGIRPIELTKENDVA